MVSMQGKVDTTVAPRNARVSPGNPDGLVSLVAVARRVSFKVAGVSLENSFPPILRTSVVLLSRKSFTVCRLPIFGLHPLSCIFKFFSHPVPTSS